MKDLKRKTVRGGIAKLSSQAATFAIRVGGLMVLARLLDPKDFGLVGMVMAVIGILNLFRDFGLSTATVQRSSITDEQMSTVFWINMAVGAILGILLLFAAPVLAYFYREQRLIEVTSVLSSVFFINAACVQHSALLQREMRFVALGISDVLSLVGSTAVGIGMAVAGYKYWSLVGMAIASPIITGICVWVSTRWIPGKPCRHVGVRSMMRFGGTVTLNGLVVYLAYNMEKVLLGRFWGAEALGLYGRAYQLINIPTDNFNAAVGGVAFSALSRVQDDPDRLKGYFLKGYSLALALTIPTTMFCALFANDIITVVLGSKWQGAVPIFRLLAPTILIFALINPLAWLLFSLGLVRRSLNVAFVLAPLVICGYVAGLHYGPKGVALGYSTVMILWVVPHIAWCVHGTIVSIRDIWRTAKPPLVSGVVAALLSYCAQSIYPHWITPLGRLIVGGMILSNSYLLIILFANRQASLYFDLLKHFIDRSSSTEKVAASL